MIKYIEKYFKQKNILIKKLKIFFQILFSPEAI